MNYPFLLLKNKNNNLTMEASPEGGQGRVWVAHR